MKSDLLRLPAALAIAAVASFAQAQDFPSKPFRILVGFAAGGPTDLVARAIADRLKDGVKQPVVVENRPGAGSIVAVQEAARAAPDGYTLLFSGSTKYILPHVQPIPVDLFKDIAPISKTATLPLLIVTHSAAPYRTFREFLDYAKANPGKVNAGVASHAGTDHLGFELIALRAGLKMTVIPFKGAAAALPEIMAGRLDVQMSTPQFFKSAIDAGKLRSLAVTLEKRVSFLPDVPTVAEHGMPGYDVSSWSAIYTTAGTPRSTIARLDQELRAALSDKALIAKMSELNYFPDYLPSDALAALSRKTFDDFGLVVKAAGIKMQ